MAEVQVNIVDAAAAARRPGPRAGRAGPQNRRRLRKSNWTFTIFNYTPLYLDNIKTRLSTNHTIQFVVFQEEIAPTTGNRHIQGFIQFKARQYFNTVVHLLEADPTDLVPSDPGVHPSVRAKLGSIKSAIDYCRKADTRVPNTEPWDCGTPRGYHDYKVVEEVRLGSSLREIALNHPDAVMHHPTGIRLLVQLHTAPRQTAPKLKIFIGASGTGKTYTINKKITEKFGGSGYYFSYPHSKSQIHWCDLYSQQRAFVFDEFASRNLSSTFFNRIFEYTPFIVQVKGSSTQFNSEIVYIGSNYNPAYWWQDQADQNTMLRRIRDFGKIYLMEDPMPRNDDGFPSPRYREVTLDECERLQQTWF